MAIFKQDNIIKTCTIKEGKLVCYAVDLNSLPPGSEDIEAAQRKCVITFEGNVPTYQVVGKAEDLCQALLTDLGKLLRKAKQEGIPVQNYSKIIKEVSKQASPQE